MAKKSKSDEYDVSATKKKKKKVKAEAVEVKKKKKVSVSDDYDPVFEDEYADELKPKKKKKTKSEKEEVKPPKTKKLDKEKELKKLKRNKKQLREASELLEKIAADTKSGGGQKRGAISRTDTGKLVSIVGEHAEEIHNLLESEDIDGAAMAIRKRTLQSMIDVLPYIEDNIRSSGGKQGSYHLKSLYECIHSILGELQALKDRDVIALNLVNDILQPFITRIVNSIIMELNNITTDLRPLVRDDAKQELNQTLNASRTRMGQQLSTQYAELKNATLQYLQNNL